MTSSNPLLQASPLPYGAVPFDRLQPEQYLPALEAQIGLAKAALAELKADPATANFANTIVALETATAGVYDVAYIYSNLRSAHGDAQMQALAKEIMPKLMQLESDINLDPEIFRRVQAAYEHAMKEDQAGTAKLTAEQRMLAERTYRSLRRNGGVLSDAGKAKLRQIDEELSTLGPRFSENVLKATNAYTLTITDKSDLAGLTESAIEAAAVAAEERGHKGQWIFTLQGPSVLALLKYSDKRDLREQVWRAYNSRAFAESEHGEGSNQDLIKRIALLRHERAALLGYQSHAHFQMEERMAEHPDKVREFLGRLLAKSKPAGDQEMAELRTFMRESGERRELQPWDYAYWANKLKESRYQLNAEETRPYFSLDKVLAGAFEHASRLYDLRFTETKEVPVYAPDVQVFTVTHAKSGEYMGLLYTDFYPRATKGGGAWCTRFKGQYEDADGKSQRPHVSIVCSFTKPTPTKPSLLTYQEVNTLFHEFGHALHSLLSRCKYRSLSCTNVYRDFVELPSQLMENWIKEKASLALFAKHYTTGEDIPEALVEKLCRSENFHAGYMMMRQLRFAFLDLAWYSASPAGVKSVAEFEGRAVAATDLLPAVPGTNVSCAFEHIFSGGYSAGYYGYKWAEVLDADAFELFKERGIFSREVADRFRKSVLERGGSEHPMTLYQEFRGRAPDPDALLRRCHLI